MWMQKIRLNPTYISPTIQSRTYFIYHIVYIYIYIYIILPFAVNEFITISDICTTGSPLR